MIAFIHIHWEVLFGFLMGALFAHGAARVGWTGFEPLSEWRRIARETRVLATNFRVVGQGGRTVGYWRLLWRGLRRA